MFLLLSSLSSSSSSSSFQFLLSSLLLSLLILLLIVLFLSLWLPSGYTDKLEMYRDAIDVIFFSKILTTSSMDYNTLQDLSVRINRMLTIEKKRRKLY